MQDLNIVDSFLDTFVHYIDSGFGLLQGDVAFLTTILIGIDITLAGLFWALGTDDALPGKLLRKVLYVGAFAFILNRFETLAGILFDSFAGLGLTAGGLAADDLLRPGRIAGTGFEAAWPLLDHVADMVGFPEVFSNLLSVVVLLLAWVLVIVAFFVLSVQLFITILEFKLTTLAGFVLVPFALWNKTAFLAERVLGAVVAAGIKVMVLAVIVGIGAGLFDTFTEALDAGEPTIEAAMSLVLASLALLGLGIFGPGIAAGLVTGAPQLGAGAVLGTGGAAAGVALIGGGTALAGARLAGTGGLAAVRAGTALGTGAASAFRLGEATSGTSGPCATLAGLGGMARAAGSAATRPLREAAADGRRAAWTATGGTAPAGSAGPIPDPSSSAPAWARRLRTEQQMRARMQDAQQTLRDGDRPGGGTAPSLGDTED